MCHMFACFREKPAFPTKDTPIGKRKLFLLGRRAVFSCRHKSVHELIEKIISKFKLFAKTSFQKPICTNQIL